MAAPLAVPLAIGVGKGIKVGLGAALRYGPILLDMADQFKRSPGLAPPTGQAGSQQRLGELLRDAVAGARVAVATPPPPPLPFNNGPDSWKVPPEIERALRPLLDALQRLGQFWGAPNGTSAVELPVTWDDMNGVENNLTSPSTIEVSADTVTSFGQTHCFLDSSVSSGPFTMNRTKTASDVVSYTLNGLGTVAGGAGCGFDGVFLTVPDATISWTDSQGNSFADAIGFGGQFANEPWNSSSGSVEQTVVSVEISGKQVLPPPIFVPAGPSTAPVADPEPLAKTETAAAVAAPAPLAVPLLAAQVAGSGNSASAGSGVAGGSLPAAGAVAVPSNPPANWFRKTETTPGTVPAPVPRVAPTPAYVPRPVPGPSPSGDPAPAPQTEPQPAQVPGTKPAPPTTAPSVPQPGPVAPPLTLPGTVASPAATPAPTTAPGTHFPVPGAPPVTANGPAPTLQEMAKEMGRQEQKLQQLLQRSSQPDGKPVDLGEILRRLLQLLDLLNASDGRGGYMINSPCNVDEETGELLDPMITEWEATIGIKGALVKRIDALAQLLQFQKELPQPICSRKKPTGDFVTVNFEQINDDLETP